MPDLTSGGDSDSEDSDTDGIPDLDDKVTEESDQEMEGDQSSTTFGAADTGQRNSRSSTSSGIRAGFLVPRRTQQNRQDRSPAPPPTGPSTSAPAPAANGHASAKEVEMDLDGLPALVHLSEDSEQEEDEEEEEEGETSGDDDEVPGLGDGGSSHDSDERLQDDSEEQASEQDYATEDQASDDGIPALESQEDSDNENDEHEDDDSDSDSSNEGSRHASEPNGWGGLESSKLRGACALKVHGKQQM